MMFDKSTWPVVKEIEGKTVKKATAETDDNGYPTVLIEFTDGVHLLVEETGQAGWIAVHVLISEPPMGYITDVVDTLRWVVVNGISFIVNDGVINAYQTDGMTMCDYDADVPDCHWDNVERIYPGAKLADCHRVSP